MVCSLIRVMTAVVLLIPTVAAAGQPLNILFFGNSFTHQHDVPAMVSRLAVAGGHEAPHVVSAAKSGRPLAYHLRQVAESPQENVDHPSMSEKMWDYVVIQGHSVEPTHLGDPKVFPANVEALFVAVRDHPSGRGTKVKAILYQTWAREAGHAYYPEHFESPAAMQAVIVEQYQRAHTQIQAAHGTEVSRIAPVGEAFEAAGFARDLYGGDRYHASRKGSLLAAMVLYRTIYEQDTAEIEYDAIAEWIPVDAATWRQLVELVDARTP